MSSQIDLISALSNPPELSDYVQYLHDAIETDAGQCDRKRFIQVAFQFIESHADNDLGAPGPLVHLLEAGYPDYCDELCVSIARHPTELSLWMANRVLNGGPKPELAKRLREALVSIRDDEGVHELLRDQAREFMELQEQ